MRRTLAVLAATVLVLLASVPASGAGPTLGGRLVPATVILEKGRAVQVSNLSDVPVTVTVQADRPGWEFDVSTFDLEPEASRAVTITKAATDAARLSVRLAPLGLVGSGMDTTSVVLGATVRHWTWLDEYGWALLPAAIGFLLVLGVLLLLIRRRWST